MGGQKFIRVDKILYGGTKIYRGDKNEPVPNIHHMHSYVSVYVTQLDTVYTCTDIFSGVARVSAAWGGLLICRSSSFFTYSSQIFCIFENFHLSYAPFHLLQRCNFAAPPPKCAARGGLPPSPPPCYATGQWTMDIICILYNIHDIKTLQYTYIAMYIWAYFKIVFSLRRDIFHGVLPINTFP